MFALTLAGISRLYCETCSSVNKSDDIYSISNKVYIKS